MAGCYRKAASLAADPRLWYTLRHFTSSSGERGSHLRSFFSPEDPASPGWPRSADGAAPAPERHPEVIHLSTQLTKAAPSATHHPSAGAATSSVSAARVLEAALEPVATPFGFEIIQIEVAGGRGAKVVRVFLDRLDRVAAAGGGEGSAEGAAQGGVTIGDCAKMSRLFGNAFDAAEAAAEAGEDPDGTATEVARVLDGAYTLEVSSPGLDRPLAKRRHFEQFVGHRVEIKTHEPLEEGSNRRTYHAVLEAVRGDDIAPDDPHAGFIVIQETERDEVHELPLSSIRKANVVYEG